MRLILTTATLLASLALAGCLGGGAEPPPPSSTPTTAATCEAMRPAMPIRYSSKSDTLETVKQVREVNARYAAACP